MPAVGPRTPCKASVPSPCKASVPSLCKASVPSPCKASVPSLCKASVPSPCKASVLSLCKASVPSLCKASVPSLCKASVPSALTQAEGSIYLFSQTVSWFAVQVVWKGRHRDPVKVSVFTNCQLVRCASGVERPTQRPRQSICFHKLSTGSLCKWCGKADTETSSKPRIHSFINVFLIQWFHQRFPDTMVSSTFS